MPTEPDLELRWRQREAWWRKKLGRLRLGVEPLAEQVTRYRRVTWALTVVPSILAIMFVALFTAFGRPDIGVVLCTIVLAPIVLFAWIDQVRLARRARRYLAELEDYRRAGEDQSSGIASENRG
jgi:hypothetical protein